MFAAVHFMACDGERSLQSRVGKVGQFLADSRLYFDWIFRGGVLRHDGGKLFPVGLSQGSRRLRKGFRGFRRAAVDRVGTATPMAPPSSGRIAKTWKQAR